MQGRLPKISDSRDEPAKDGRVRRSLARTAGRRGTRFPIEHILTRPVHDADPWAGGIRRYLKLNA